MLHDTDHDLLFPDDVSAGAARVREWSARLHGPVGADGPEGHWARSCAALLDAGVGPHELPAHPDAEPGRRAEALDLLTALYVEAIDVARQPRPSWAADPVLDVGRPGAMLPA